MSLSSFRVRVPGKWVLTGEHAVIRGAAAVALPHPEFGLTLTFQPQIWEGLQIAPLSAASVIEELLQALRDEWERDGKSFPVLSGSLQIESTIPIGAGLGSSAALCVALVRWLSEALGIAEGQVVEVATQLEHRFHGKSSGMDVATIAAGEPISFLRGQVARPLGVKRLPKFTFHDTGLRAATRDCVRQVEELKEKDLMLAQRLDEQMGAASRAAMEGLLAFGAGDDAKGLERVARAMRSGQECFHAWGLVPPQVRELEERLLGEGALAVKTTGAGGGGMLVALKRWSPPFG